MCSHNSGIPKEAERCSASPCAVNMLIGAVFRVPQRRRRCRAERGYSLFSLHYSGIGGGFFLWDGVVFPVKFSGFLVQSFPLSFPQREQKCIDGVSKYRISCKLLISLSFLNEEIH